MNDIVRTTRMEPDVQRNVDIVWMENNVTIPTGLVTMGVRLGIMILYVKESVHRGCSELIVCKTAVRIVTMNRVVMGRLEPA